MANIKCSNINKLRIYIYFSDQSKRLLWKSNHGKNRIYGYGDLWYGSLILLYNFASRSYPRPLHNVIHDPFANHKQKPNFLWNLHTKLIPSRV